MQRWEEGTQNALQLWREVKEQGFGGCAAAVQDFLRPLRQPGMTPAPSPSDTDHRHHLVCDSCGAIADFEGCMVDATLAQSTLPPNFQVTRHTLTLHGTCERCQTKLASQ